METVEGMNNCDWVSRIIKDGQIEYMDDALTEWLYLGFLPMCQRGVVAVKLGL